MVIVFGGINVDGVVLAEHLPQPGETVVGATYARHPGGKGANQAVAAARYGSAVRMVGCVGADANADFALNALVQAGINTEAVRVGRRERGKSNHRGKRCEPGDRR